MKYDAAIIGAGIGGLAAAARLADAGYTTIILEKQDVLGGRYTAGDYRGYRIQNAAYYIVHPNGPVIQLLKDLGVLSQIEIASAPQPYLEYRIDGKDYPLPKKGGALALLPEIASAEESERVQNAFRSALRWQEPVDGVSAKDWLSEYTANKKIHQVFNMMCLGAGGNVLSEVPAREFVRIIKCYGKYGGEWVLPRGHLRTLVDAVVGAIKSLGGEIRTKTRVKQIVVDKMMVKGVVAETEDGKELEIAANVVINDCSPHEMIRMAGENNFDKGYLKKVQGMKPVELFNVIWGCEKPMFEWPGVINFPQYDNPCHGFYALDFSLTWRDIAPQGKYTLWAGFFLPAEYDIRKEIERGIRQCKENFPELERHGEILLVEVFRKTWPGLWATCGTDLEQKTPIENLYVVGDGAKPSGHTMAEGVTEGAKLAVEDIKTRIKPGA